MAGLWSRLTDGLTKTRTVISERLQTLVPLGGRIKEDTWEELEEILLAADVGLEVAEELLTEIRKERPTSVQDIQRALASKMVGILETDQFAQTEPVAFEPPLVILVVGVNGVGKTTSIAKLASHYRLQGKRVMLAACDTFRAAAGEQLAIWAERTGSELIAHQDGADPGAVAFDAAQAALARRADVLIVDTAGRLQTKKNLMQELAKIQRVLAKVRPDLPHEVILVLDATTGQNALSQARLFQEAVPITGILLAKLDGTAKGGIVLAIQRELKIPIKWLGMGEKHDDLEVFEARSFVSALLESE